MTLRISRRCRDAAAAGRGCARLFGLVTNVLSLAFLAVHGVAAVAAGRIPARQRRHDAWSGRCRFGRSRSLIAAGSVFLLTGVFLQTDRRLAALSNPQQPAHPDAVAAPSRIGRSERSPWTRPCWRYSILGAAVRAARRRHADRLCDGAIGVSRHAAADRRAMRRSRCSGRRPTRRR